VLKLVNYQNYTKMHGPKIYKKIYIKNYDVVLKVKNASLKSVDSAYRNYWSELRPNHLNGMV
jgi:adenylate cyclase